MCQESQSSRYTLLYFLSVNWDMSVAAGFRKLQFLGSFHLLLLMVIISGVGGRWVMTVPAGSRGLDDGKAPGCTRTTLLPSIWGNCWETLQF